MTLPYTFPCLLSSYHTVVQDDTCNRFYLRHLPMIVLVRVSISVQWYEMVHISSHSLVGRGGGEGGEEEGRGGGEGGEEGKERGREGGGEEGRGRRGACVHWGCVLTCHCS